jgi:hypothetical protein
LGKGSIATAGHGDHGLATAEMRRCGHASAKRMKSDMLCPRKEEGKADIEEVALQGK